MRTTEIEYRADSQRCVGYLSEPDGAVGRGPGVLVLHEAPGLGKHAKRSAERLAEFGYVAFAADYIGEGRILANEEVPRHMQELIPDTDRIRRLGQGALDVLRHQAGVDPARLAAIGYCFGGTMGLEMARSGADLKAVMVFRSGLRTNRPQDARQITGSVLVYLGADDSVIPPEQRAAFEEEMRASGADWRLYLHGRVGHSFTNPDGSAMAGIAYDSGRPPVMAGASGFPGRDHRYGWPLKGQGSNT